MCVCCCSVFPSYNSLHLPLFPCHRFVDYGCMLQIRCVHFLPDGRSVVDTVGGERFRVLARGMRDGYHVADIEYLEDMKVPQRPHPPPSVHGERQRVSLPPFPSSQVTDVEEKLKLQDLYDQVYRQAHTWFGSLEPRFRDQILQHFGPMPAREIDIQVRQPTAVICTIYLQYVIRFTVSEDLRVLYFQQMYQ